VVSSRRLLVTFEVGRSLRHSPPSLRFYRGVGICARYTCDRLENMDQTVISCAVARERFADRLSLFGW